MEFLNFSCKGIVRYSKLESDILNSWISDKGLDIVNQEFSLSQGEVVCGSFFIERTESLVCPVYTKGEKIRKVSENLEDSALNLGDQYDIYRQEINRKYAPNAVVDKVEGDNSGSPLERVSGYFFSRLVILEIHELPSEYKT